MYQFMFEKDEEKKKALEATFKTETLPNYLKNMEKILTARGGKHFAGDSVICTFISN
jgi:Glutathione S-transferase, C-terminal domain